MRRRWLMAILSTAALVVAPVGAFAQEPTTDSPASSGAVAANAADVVTVSETATRNGSGSADATVLAIGDNTVVGGSQSGEGSKSGNVVSTGQTPLGSATVGGWSTSVDGQGNSAADASVAHVNIGGASGGDIRVLGSRSNASGSRSQASSYGVHAAGGGHELYLLRSDADTTGSATTALIDIDGNVIVPNEAAQQVCALTPAGLLDLACVYAEVSQVDVDGDGVPDGDQATAGVVDGSVVDNLPLDVVQAGGVVTSDDTVTPGPTPTPPPGSPDPDPNPAPLPRTGIPAFGLLAAALTAMGAGDALRRRGR